MNHVLSWYDKYFQTRGYWIEVNKSFEQNNRLQTACIQEGLVGAEGKGYLLVLEFRSFSRNKEHIILKSVFFELVGSTPPPKPCHIWENHGSWQWELRCDTNLEIFIGLEEYSCWLIAQLGFSFSVDDGCCRLNQLKVPQSQSVPSTMEWNSEKDKSPPHKGLPTILFLNL